MRKRQSEEHRQMLRRTVGCALVVGAAAAALAVVLGTQTARGQSPNGRGEWPAYAGDERNQHYSPLDAVNAQNFSRLELAWRFKTDALGSRPEYKLKGTPLMVGRTLYATGGTRRAIIALDAATGELKWMHSLREGARSAASPRQLSGRGLGVLDRRHRGADPLRHDRLSVGRARCEDRQPDRVVWRQRASSIGSRVSPI